MLDRLEDPMLHLRRLGVVVLSGFVILYALFTTASVTRGILTAGVVAVLWWDRTPVDEILAALVGRDFARAAVAAVTVMLAAVGAYTIAGLF